MADSTTRFFQGAVARGVGTVIVNTVPAGSIYNVTNITLINNNNNVSIAGSIYINSINNNNAIIPSGSLISPTGFLQTTDMWVLAAGEAMYAVLASGTSGMTASVHGVIST